MRIHKMADIRVTIRNPNPELLELFRATARANKMTLGECFNLAFETWYNGLPELESDEICAADYCN